MVYNQRAVMASLYELVGRDSFTLERADRFPSGVPVPGPDGSGAVADVCAVGYDFDSGSIRIGLSGPDGAECGNAMVEEFPPRVALRIHAVMCDYAGRRRERAACLKTVMECPPEAWADVRGVAVMDGRYSVEGFFRGEDGVPWLACTSLADGSAMNVRLHELSDTDAGVLASAAARVRRVGKAEPQRRPAIRR